MGMERFSKAAIWTFLYRVSTLDVIVLLGKVVGGQNLCLCFGGLRLECSKTRRMDSGEAERGWRNRGGAAALGKAPLRYLLHIHPINRYLRLAMAETFVYYRFRASHPSLFKTHPRIFAFAVQGLLPLDSRTISQSSSLGILETDES